MILGMQNCIVFVAQQVFKVGFTQKAAPVFTKGTRARDVNLVVARRLKITFQMLLNIGPHFWRRHHETPNTNALLRNDKAVDAEKFITDFVSYRRVENFRKLPKQLGCRFSMRVDRWEK
jgi:hypothetical protein